MKRILSTALLCLASAFAFAQTFPVQNLQVNGTSQLTGNVTASAAISASGPLNGAYVSPLTGAASRSLNGKLCEWVSAIDFGAVYSGRNNDDTAMAAWAAACAAKICYLPAGAYKTTLPIAIASGSTVLSSGSAVVNYSGTGAAFTVTSGKDVTFDQLHVSLSGTGAIGLQVQGGWFINLYAPKIDSTAGTGQTGIQIVSSAVGSLAFGAYMIEIHNPDMTVGTGLQYGIRTIKQTSDSVGITHLSLYGGWFSSVTSPVYLTNTSTFRITGMTTVAAVDAVSIGTNSAQGFISTGELDSTGYGINFLDNTITGMAVVTPSHAGATTGAFINTANYNPQIFDYNTVRLNATQSGVPANAAYNYQLLSQFTAAATVVETAQSGGSVQTLRTYGSAIGGSINGQQVNWIAGLSHNSTAANNFIGTVNATGTGTTFSVSFGVNEADTSYIIELTPQSVIGGTPAAGSNRVASIAKTTSGFTVTTEVAPGTGNTLQWGWQLSR